MTTSCRRFLRTAIALAGVSCYADSTGPRPLRTLADVAGAWTLTVWEAVSVTDTTQRLDIKAELNAQVTLVVARDGAATLTSSVYGQSPNVALATISVSGDTLVYHALTGDHRFLLGGTIYHMIWRGVVPQYQDVNGDGLADETRTLMEFVRS